MAIGEFGGAPVAPANGGFVLSAPMYWFYEMTQAALNPSLPRHLQTLWGVGYRFVA